MVDRARWGAYVHAVVPVPRLAELAAAAEQRGAAVVIVPDEGTDRDVYVTLTAMALATERITARHRDHEPAQPPSGGDRRRVRLARRGRPGTGRRGARRRRHDGVRSDGVAAGASLHVARRVR